MCTTVVPGAADTDAGAEGLALAAPLAAALPAGLALAVVLLTGLVLAGPAVLGAATEAGAPLGAACPPQPASSHNPVAAMLIPKPSRLPFIPASPFGRSVRRIVRQASLSAACYAALVSLTYVKGTVRSNGRQATLDFLVDSGATYSLIPHDAWLTLGLRPEDRQEFVLADGTAVERNLAECRFELDQRSTNTWV